VTSPSLRFGTSSWSEKTWLGAFYPSGTKPADQLTYYATQFTTVEADNTYYRIPNSALVRGWRHKTPSGFHVAAKFPRSIVHGGNEQVPDAARVLVHDAIGADLEAYLGGMSELGDRAGPLVLQFPYFNRSAFTALGHFLERLDPFLGRLPREFRYGVEVRNKNWLEKSFFDCLRAHDVAWVAVDLPYMPHPLDLAPDVDPITTDFVYARLIGDRKAVEAATEKFDRIVLDKSPSLERWATWLALQAPRVRETFAYANNHFAGHGPATIRELARLVDSKLG
jgi:uncharacterized protein YecE (DUF72 family)